MRLRTQAQILSCVALAVVPILCTCSKAAHRDPRLLMFDKFLRADTSDQSKPLVSGVLARQFATLDAKAREEAVKGITSVRSLHYDPRIVNVDSA